MPQVNKIVFAAHKFNNMSNLSFSAADYSKMKHGSKKIARKFGVELATKFLSSPGFLNLYKQIEGQEILVMSAPYKNIPVASTALKDYFISKFNPIWGENNPAVESMKVSRAHSYREDYGSMDVEQREKAITSDAFYIDKEYIKGKVLIFIDDVKITGSHERRIEAMLNTTGFEGIVIYLYFAEYLGAHNPQIENELNYFFVKKLLDIDHIIKNDEFMFNTRVVKYILDQPSKYFRNFVDYQSEDFLHQFRKELIGNEYHRIPEFTANYEYLKNKLN
jgi:hypothetical protein